MTQLGHVKDLATAFAKILGNPKAARQIYNVSGERFVTFDGIAKACAIAAGAPEPEIVHFNAKEYDFDGKKPFPLRDQHFFTSIDKACICLPCLHARPHPLLVAYDFTDKSTVHASRYRLWRMQVISYADTAV